MKRNRIITDFFRPAAPPIPLQSGEQTVNRIAQGTQADSSNHEDDDGSDSDLQDLDVILTKKRKSTRSSGHIATPRNIIGQSPRDHGSLCKQNPPKRQFKSIVAQRKKPRISVSDLALHSEKELEEKARANAAKEKMEAASAAADAAQKRAGQYGRLTMEGLNAALGDEEGAQRTLDALKRTEALETVQVWQFFADNDAQVKMPPKLEFPTDSLSGNRRYKMLIEPSTRNALFTSGMVRCSIPSEALPDDLVLWIVEQVLRERNENLIHAYLSTLKCCNPSQLGMLLDKQRLCNHFEKLGAKMEAITVESEQAKITPSTINTSDPKIHIPRNLSHLLDLLRMAAPGMQTESLEYMLEVLMWLSFDNSVRQDGCIQGRCHNALIAALHSISREGLDRVSLSVFRKLGDSRPSSRVLQAQLALAFFLERSKPLTLSLTAPGILPGIVRYLDTSPLFKFTQTTDYGEVTAAITLLDVAVDYGFSDRAFTHTLHGVNRRAHDAATRNAARDAEDEFNQGIDALATAVRRITGQIRGSGTESTCMSEAKGAMERLAYRLKISVRTKEANATDIFADTTRRSASFLKTWVGAGGSSVGDASGEPGGEKSNEDTRRQ